MTRWTLRQLGRFWLAPVSPAAAGRHGRHPELQGRPDQHRPRRLDAGRRVRGCRGGRSRRLSTVVGWLPVWQARWSPLYSPCSLIPARQPDRRRSGDQLSGSGRDRLSLQDMLGVRGIYAPEDTRRNHCLRSFRCLSDLPLAGRSLFGLAAGVSVVACCAADLVLPLSYGVGEHIRAVGENPGCCTNGRYFRPRDAVSRADSGRGAVRAGRSARCHWPTCPVPRKHDQRARLHRPCSRLFRVRPPGADGAGLPDVRRSQALQFRLQTTQTLPTSFSRCCPYDGRDRPGRDFVPQRVAQGVVTQGLRTHRKTAVLVIDMVTISPIRRAKCPTRQAAEIVPRVDALVQRGACARRDHHLGDRLAPRRQAGLGAGERARPLRSGHARRGAGAAARARCLTIT